MSGLGTRVARFTAATLIIGGGALAFTTGSANATGGAGVVNCVDGVPKTTFTIFGNTVDPSKDEANYTYDYGKAIPQLDQHRVNGVMNDASITLDGVVPTIVLHGYFNGPESHSDRLLTLHVQGAVPDCAAPPTTSTTSLVTTTTAKATTTTVHKRVHKTTTTIRKHTGPLPHTGSDGQRQGAGAAMVLIGIGWLTGDAAKRRKPLAA